MQRNSYCDTAIDVKFRALGTTESHVLTVCSFMTHKSHQLDELYTNHMDSMVLGFSNVVTRPARPEAYITARGGNPEQVRCQWWSQVQLTIQRLYRVIESKCFTACSLPIVAGCGVD